MSHRGPPRENGTISEIPFKNIWTEREWGGTGRGRGI